MKERLKIIYKVINQKHPALGSLLWRLYCWKPFNNDQKKIKGKNNVINYNGSILSSVVFDIVGNNNKIEIKNSCFLKSVTFYIRGNNHSVSIGEGCRFNRGGNIWFEDSFGTLEIGDRSTFEDVHIAVTEQGSVIKIGRDCMFAYDIDIRAGDSHSIIDTNKNERINYAKDVSIGNHVWIAAHCIILKGTCIADESVLATGSVVTKKFLQTGTIIAGNPACVVKEGISWSKERI
jgi:acetyltransferase-like isoleucine patch superfamily enzyme